MRDRHEIPIKSIGMASVLLVTGVDGTPHTTGHVVGSADEMIGRSANGRYEAGALYLRVMIAGTKHFFHGLKDYEQYSLFRQRGDFDVPEDVSDDEEDSESYVFDQRWWPELSN